MFILQLFFDLGYLTHKYENRRKEAVVKSLGKLLKESYRCKAEKMYRIEGKGL